MGKFGGWAVGRYPNPDGPAQGGTPVGQNVYGQETSQNQVNSYAPQQTGEYGHLQQPNPYGAPPPPPQQQQQQQQYGANPAYDQYGASTQQQYPSPASQIHPASGQGPYDQHHAADYGQIAQQGMPQMDANLGQYNGTAGYGVHAQGGYANADGYQPSDGGVHGMAGRMEQMTLAGRPLPPGYPSAAGVQQAAPMSQSSSASQANIALPRPKFDSESVLARLNDMDVKAVPAVTGSMASPPQMDAHGRPLQPNAAIRPQKWPPTVACPQERFYPTSPRCARMTTNAFPNSNALAKKYGLPLGAVLQPMEDGDQLPLVNFGNEVVRCSKCRSYINFMCKFLDNGWRWRCSLCQMMNDTPRAYYSALDANGHRADVASRPELICGSFEVRAPVQYMLRPPMPPVYLFVVEVTPAAVGSGLLSAAVTGIRDSLDLLPNDGRTKVGLLTFDSTVHFYRFKGDPKGTGDKSTDAAVLILPDINDIFLPAPDQMVVPLQEYREAIEQLLDSLPSMYASAANQTGAANSSNSAFGAAVVAAQTAIANEGGKMMCFLSSRPKVGPGMVKDRSDNTALGTNRETALLSPDSPFYKQKAVELTRQQITVDLILAATAVGSFLDVATIAPLAKYTGGELIYNPCFDLRRDGHLLVESVKRILGREIGWEGVMRIRASKGIRCSTFHGRFFIKTTDLLALPNIDPDKSFAVEFTYDENVLEHQVFCVQIALLYTTSSGERRIRVHTVTIPVVSSLGDLFLYTDAQATTNLLVRKAGEALRDKRLEDVRKTILDPLVHALSAYRQATRSQFTSSGMAAGTGGLVLPESLSLLPLLLQGHLKSPIFSRDAYTLFGFRTDDKSAAQHALNIASSAVTTCIAYPTILPVFPLDDQPEAGVYTEDENGVIGVTLPHALPACQETLHPERVLLIDDGIATIVWIGSAAMGAFCAQMVPESDLQGDLHTLAGACVYGEPSGDSGRVRAIIRVVRGLRRSGAPLHIVIQGNSMQSRVDALMVEERTSSEIGYRDFLTDIQNKVSVRSG
mmetsp:Transcript_7595/g.23024  ORF Transcript_7595/g.23024 Transcript_7595/m.23024 type:complete len:1028 (+) Transcript_7595:426-3509(+)